MTGEGRPDGDATETAHNPVPGATATVPRDDCRRAGPPSQQVSWWSVHEHVAALLRRVESWPLIGSPGWCALDPDDPAKLAALFDAAQHWALRVETCQQARCDASREISDAGDWSALAKQAFVRSCFYAARPWLRRSVSHD